MGQSFWKSNGTQPRKEAVNSDQTSRVRRDWRWRYGVAVTAVLLAWLFVFLGNLLIPAPPFIFFAASVIVTVMAAGIRPALFALLLATILSDFFFVHPRFELSLSTPVFRLSLYYLIAGGLAYFIARRIMTRFGRLMIFPF